MFQPGLLGAYTPPPNTLLYRPNAVPYDYNKYQYQNQVRNQPTNLSGPRYPQPQYYHQQQPPLHSNVVHQDRNLLKSNEWPSLSDAKPRNSVTPQTKSQQGYKDTDSPDVCLSKDQQEEKKQLYKLFYQVLRDNGPMDVCNQQILSTFMSLPESKRQIISKIGGIQRFFLKSPMFLIQGDIVCIAEENANNSPSPPKTEADIRPRNGPYRSSAEKRQNDASQVAKTHEDSNSQLHTPAKACLDVQAQPFSPQTPVKTRSSSSLQSPCVELKDVESKSASRTQSESDADDILLELKTSFEQMQINHKKTTPVSKSAEDCCDVFTEKAKLLGIEVGESKTKDDAASNNNSETNTENQSVNNWRERRKSSESRPFSASARDEKEKNSDGYKHQRQLETSMKQKLELELTQVKLNNMELTTEQIERRAQMKIKVKDMDLKKVNTELSEALNQITELTAKNNKLQNINVGLIASVTKLTNENNNLQEDILKKDLMKANSKDTDEMTMKLKEALARAREAEITVLDCSYKDCLDRIDKVVKKKESNFISMFSPEDNIPVDTLWKEYVELVDVQKADLKEQYDKILESLKKDISLKDCPPLLEQDISVFVKKGRKEKLLPQTSGEAEKNSCEKPSIMNKRPMFGTSLSEKRKSPVNEHQPLRHPRRNPVQMFTAQPTTVAKPPGFDGVSPFSKSDYQVQPLLRPRLLATSPPVPQFSSLQNAVPLISSPPFSSSSTDKKQPILFNTKLAPSFNFNPPTQNIGYASMHPRFQQPVPFNVMPTPAIPVLTPQQVLPSVPPLNQYLPTTASFQHDQIPSSMGVNSAVNTIPKLMDLKFDRGDNIQQGQAKRKIEVYNPTNYIPNLMDIKLSRNEVPAEHVTGENLDISCATFHVELDETECWDDEDYPPTKMSSTSRNTELKPSIGYNFADPTAGDVSLCMSDLVKTLQTWSQEIPSSFKVDKGGAECEKTPSPQKGQGNEELSTEKISPKLSPSEVNSKQCSAGCEGTPPNVSNSSKPSVSPFGQGARKWQEVTKKKKRKVQPVQVPIVMNEMKKPQSSLDKIVYTLTLKLPHLERSDFVESIKVVRDFHRGSLSGVPLTEIVGKCTEYLKDRERRKSMPDGDNSICAVCHEDLEDKQVNKLECGHDFHDDCIKLWIRTRERTCPLCRKFILLPDDFPAL